VEALAPINIALVKYWSKAHKSLIIPSNNSFSITLNKDNLCSKTTLKLMPEGQEEVELILNGTKESKVSDRVLGVIKTVKELVA
jgi:diphosphomevalonate decarboxylase